MATSYALHMRPGRLEVEADGERAAIVRLSDVYNFVDSHNVGVFEGILKHAGVRGSVKVRTVSPTSADLRCAW
jgi:anti-anti-sigma regulatory factor